MPASSWPADDGFPIVAFFDFFFGVAFFGAFFAECFADARDLASTVSTSTGLASSTLSDSTLAGSASSTLSSS